MNFSFSIKKLKFRGCLTMIEGKWPKGGWKRRNRKISPMYESIGHPYIHFQWKTFRDTSIKVWFLPISTPTERIYEYANWFFVEILSFFKYSQYPWSRNELKQGRIQHRDTSIKVWFSLISTPTEKIHEYTKFFFVEKLSFFKKT